MTAAAETTGPAAAEDAPRTVTTDDLAESVLASGVAGIRRPLARALRRLLAERAEDTEGPDGAEWVVGWGSCLLPPPPELVL